MRHKHWKSRYTDKNGKYDNNCKGQICAEVSKANIWWNLQKKPIYISKYSQKYFPRLQNLPFVTTKF